MTVKSVLLKLPPEVHAQVLEASDRHQRSMQKLLVALIEGWLAQGAPDPVEFTPRSDEQAQERRFGASVNAVDQRARQAIDLVAQHVLKLQGSLQELQSWRDVADRGPGRDERYWEHFSEALDVLVRQGADTPISPLQALIDETWAESSHRPAASGQDDLESMSKYLATARG